MPVATTNPVGSIGMPQDTQFIALCEFGGRRWSEPPQSGLDEMDRIQERFEQLKKEWKAAGALLSSITAKSTLPSYQQIIGLGRPAISLILRELRVAPDDWFWALYAITGENPVPERAKGRMRLMARAWLEWGRRNGGL